MIDGNMISNISKLTFFVWAEGLVTAGSEHDHHQLGKVVWRPHLPYKWHF